jgi:hypothetical protein
MAYEQRLESLKSRHEKLNFIIQDLSRQPHFDEAEIKRLKIKKLALKDQISALDGYIPEGVEIMESASA